MPKAELLRATDVRDAYRLIGECRDVGSDPALWQMHMVTGLARIFGETASGGEGTLTGAGVVPLAHFDVGFDPRERRTYLEYMEQNGAAIDPFVRALHQRPGRAITGTRSGTIPDDEYFRSPVVDRYLRPSNVHHRLASTHPTTGGAISFLHLHRARPNRDFSGRERARLEFFHAEIGPLIGRALVSAAEPTPDALPPRLRQTLQCLIQGDSEKQVAARLHVQRTTVHEYVMALYRRFGVHSRAQLLAHVVKRMGRPGWHGDPS